jgi:tetratricopeptide (TPR) repeat protein
VILPVRSWSFLRRRAATIAVVAVVVVTRAWFVAVAPTSAAAPPPTASSASAPSAQSLYDDGQALLATRESDDLVTSLQLFLEAARLDPSHARAHAGAATAASLLALYSVSPPGPLFATARAEAAAALRLDQGLAPAHAAMGLIEYLDGWDFAAAESKLREALRLDPSYAPAWHWYGMLLMATSRYDASVEAFDQALTLEPASSLFHAKRAGVLAAAGRAADAERDLRRTVERFPQSSLAHRELGYLLIEQGRAAEGLAALRRSAELLDGVEENADYAWGLARTGERGRATAIASRLVERSRTEFVSPLDLVVVYAGLDRDDEAFAWLDRAFAIHDPGLVYLATAPSYAPLRDDPRFSARLRELRLRPDPPSGGAAVESARP